MPRVPSPDDRAREVPTDVLELLKRLHDIRDSKTNLIAEEKEINEAIIAHYETQLTPPDAVGEDAIKGRGINIGVGRITRRRGRETVDIPLLRDKLGEDAEEFITHYKGSTVISHLDPYAIEKELANRPENPEEKI